MCGTFGFAFLFSFCVADFKKNETNNPKTHFTHFAIQNSSKFGFSSNVEVLFSLNGCEHKVSKTKQCE